MPRVGIVIPLYNRSEYIERTVRSVIAQTEQDWELVVVDDGSLDDSADVAERALTGERRARVIRQSNAGVNRARNVGADALDVERLMFLDADDVLERTALTNLLSVDGAVVTGVFDLLDEQDVAVRPMPPFFRRQPPGPISLRQIVAGPRITTCATLLDAVAFRTVGAWDEEFGQGLEDVELYFRMAFHGPVVRIPALVAWYRLHGSQMSLDSGLMERQKDRFLTQVGSCATERPEAADALRHYRRRTLPAERLKRAWDELRDGDIRRAAAMAASAGKRLVLG